MQHRLFQAIGNNPQDRNGLNIHSVKKVHASVRQISLLQCSHSSRHSMQNSE